MVQKLTLIFATILIFFILLFAYVKLAGPIPFQVNSITTTKTDSFQVTGEGKATIKPDTATVTVGVTAQGQTAKAAQDQMNQNINRVVEAIKALGIDSKDIQTQNYNVNPNYDYTQVPQTIKGYSANTNLVVKVKQLDKANQVLDVATQNGATQVGGVQFDNADKSKAEGEARKMAVEDAKKKATQAASTAGFTLGKLINYQEGFDGDRPVPLGAIESMSAKRADSTNIEPGTNEIRITVTLSYEVR